MDFFDVIGKRQSIRKFKEKEIEKEKIEKLLSAINAAPSAGDLQAYDVFLIKSKEKKNALAQAAFSSRYLMQKSSSQDFIAIAPCVLVFFANPARSAGKYGARGSELYCILDAAIAAAYSQLAATALDLGSVWIGAFDPEEVKKAVGTEGDLLPVAIIPVGYPGELPGKTPRRKLEDLVHKEK